MLHRAEAIFIIPLGVVLFLLGSRLLWAGAFEDSARGARLRVRLMAVGFGIGVPLNMLSTLGGLTAVGRTALSCYVRQNVVAGALCYGWGFGLATRFADARPWWVVGAWAGISVLNVALASWWLRRFDRGPLELVWHWAYRVPQRTLAPRPGAAGIPT